ncbi:DUF4252 domain-containing protein [Kriegella aquimaris]|uniref:DUF4252 domain-containing protein n=1 Tax=Kriegella aquimaris TaxID=192904 RepID=A0A1G9KAR7_9FLAO|nr:DUF4252 domain-containing protein [Kriegella aquimaris]SDL46868.1 protein of unknown function [Kriegella aquimaris]
MKIMKTIFLLTMVVTVMSCSSTQSLQEYYVDNSENPNFLSVDLPVSLLKMKNEAMTETQKEAFESLKKLNILAFKKTMENVSEYQIEKANVKAILDNDRFTELMKINTSFGKATIKYLGKDDAIDEVVIYGDNDDKGFLLVRVLGNDMNPANFFQVIKALEKSDYNGEGLKEIGELIRS